MFARKPHDSICCMRCILDKAASNEEVANEGGVVKEEEEEQGPWTVGRGP